MNEPSSEDKMYQYNAKILRVVDGDTVDVLLTLEPQRLVEMGTPGMMWWDFGFYFFAPVADASRLPRTMQRIRLLGIDTPEVRGAERPEGIVSAALQEMITVGEQNGGIKIQTEKKGKFGRYLGTLFTSDGLNLNEEMIRQGYAKEYPS